MLAWMVLLQLSIEVRQPQLKLSLKGRRGRLRHEGGGHGDAPDPQGLCNMEGLQGKEVVDDEAVAWRLLPSTLLVTVQSAQARTCSSCWVPEEAAAASMHADVHTTPCCGQFESK